MMVDPARQAASISVNGMDAKVSADIQDVPPQTQERRLLHVAHSARHWIQARGEAGGHSRGIVAQRKMLVAQDFESAMIQQNIYVGQTEIDQVTRDVDSVPALAEQEELPASGIGDLDDQASVGAQELGAASR